MPCLGHDRRATLIAAPSAVQLPCEATARHPPEYDLAGAPDHIDGDLGQELLEVRRRQRAWLWNSTNAWRDSVPLAAAQESALNRYCHP
jgi:hypothetical protein